MAVRRLTLAGRVGLEVDGAAVASGGLGRPGRLALAYLATERRRPVPRDELADVVWGEELPESWEQMLRGLALKVRRALDAAGLDGAATLVSAAGAFHLRLPPEVSVDVEEAAASLAAARAALEAGEPERAEAAAAAAAVVAARQFAPGAAGTWVERRQAELRELHLGALEALAHAALARADWHTAVAAAEEALALEPYRESAYALLMAAHAGAGSRGEALAAYERCRRVLAEELGVSPSPATEAAYLRLLGDEEAPAASGTAAPLTLPPALAASPGAFLVGREAEAEALAAAFKRAMVEGRQAVLVGGEPGVGKTTLVSQAARAAHAEGARVVYGRCDEDLGVPFQPFAQALTHYVLAAPLAELTGHVAAHGGEALRLVPALGRRLPGTPLPPPVDPDTARWRLFEAVAGLLGAAAAAAPVVVVLDDLHWAAPATLQLLRHVLTSTTDERLLVLGTYRRSEAGADLSATLADLRRLPGVQRLALEGLDRAGVEAFVAAARDPAPDELASLAQALWSHTAGNPFFVGELLRHLHETHATFRREGPWRYYAGDAGLDVPAGVVEVVERRLGRLSPAANRVLTTAAVVGADFVLDVVEGALDEADADVALDSLEQATAAQLVVEDALAGAYGFAHALVRDALYANLGAARRARLHRRVGEAIESLPGEDAQRLPALAHHFAEAAPTGCADKAADYALAAAEHLLAIPAPEAAVAVLQRAVRALECAGGGNRRRRVALMVALSSSHFSDGQNDEGREVAQAAAIEAQALGMVDALAEASILQSFGIGGQGQRADLVEAALEAVGDGSPIVRARLLGALAMVRVPFDEVSDRLTADALEMARRCGDRRVLGEALSRRWMVLLGTPNASELLAFAEERLSVVPPERRRMGYGYDNRLISRLINGDRAGFDADVEHLDRLGRKTRAWGPRSDAARWRVVQADMDGRFEEVPRLAKQADETFAEKRKPPATSFRQSTLLWNLGHFRELLDISTQGAARDNTEFHLGWLAVARAGDGEIEAAEADLAALTRALPIMRRVGRALMSANLVEVAVALGHRECAIRLYDWLLPFAGQVVTGMQAFCLGSVDRHLGMLATVLERWDDAEEHLEAGLQIDSALSSPPLLARTQYSYGRLLVRRPRGDRARAQTLLDAAGATAERLGMAALAGQVDEFRRTS